MIHMADTLIEKGNPITGDLTAKVRYCRSIDMPIMIFGSPGVGKSQQVQQAADDDDVIIDLRLNSLESIDLRGLPVIKKDAVTKNPVAVEWVRPEFIPWEGKGILFLDELNTAQPSVQNPALQLVLDRKIGSHHLGKGWYIAAACNRAEDRAHTVPLSAALLDRFAIYDYSPDHHHWTKWAMTNGVHPDVIGYVSFSPSALLQPRKDEYSPSSNPRSWCYVSKMLHAGKPDNCDIRAAVGSQASEFCAYLKVCASLPNIQMLVEGKATFTENRKEISVAYAVANAVASHLLNHASPDKVLENCVKVISGISPEPASLFYRRVMLTAPASLKNLLFHSKAVAGWIKANSDILHGAITVT